jgi:AcrR family transcriptional regulator
MAGDSLSKANYFEAALELLASGGIGAVTISALCYRLGVTKGSFYHHFESGQDFQKQLLRYWEHDRVEQLMPFLEAMDPVDRLTALKLGAVSINHEAASAIRAWARTDKSAAASQARVDRETEKLLARFLVEAGIPTKRAPLLARIGFSILVASQQLERPVDRDRLLKTFDEYQRWLESMIEQGRVAPVVSVVGRRSRAK